MLGIADYGAACAAIIVLLAVPGPGRFALPISAGKGRSEPREAGTLGATPAGPSAEVLRRA
jgi:leucine efflux protein